MNNIVLEFEQKSSMLGGFKIMVSTHISFVWLAFYVMFDVSYDDDTVSFILQARFQQYMVTTDEQLISLTHTIKNCPVINNSRQETQASASEKGATDRRAGDSPGRYILIIPEHH